MRGGTGKWVGERKRERERERGYWVLKEKLEKMVKEESACHSTKMLLIQLYYIMKKEIQGEREREREREREKETKKKRKIDR